MLHVNLHRPHDLRSIPTLCVIEISEELKSMRYIWMILEYMMESFMHYSPVMQRNVHRKLIDAWIQTIFFFKQNSKL
jgi:hypothetical protein